MLCFRTTPSVATLLFLIFLGHVFFPIMQMRALQVLTWHPTLIFAMLAKWFAEHVIAECLNLSTLRPCMYSFSCCGDNLVDVWIFDLVSTCLDLLWKGEPLAAASVWDMTDKKDGLIRGLLSATELVFGKVLETGEELALAIGLWGSWQWISRSCWDWEMTLKREKMPGIVNGSNSILGCIKWINCMLIICINIRLWDRNKNT